MALLERVSTLVRANLNDLIDKAEHPEKMIKQVILDMENQYLQVKTQVAIAIADQHLLDSAVCGEMASQPLMAFALIGLGVRQLSVAPRSVPLVKRIVRGISVAAAQEAATAAADAATAAESEAILRARLAEAIGHDAAAD